MKSSDNQSPVILFPSAGCEPLRPMTPEQAKRGEQALFKAIKTHWKNAGVQALITLMERQAALKQMHAIAPDASPHHAGQAHGLVQLLAQIHKRRLNLEQPEGEEA